LKVDPEDFRRHYASLSDDALLEIDRDELIPVAQQIYGAELARRHLAEDEPDRETAAEESQVSSFPVDDNWLESGACAHSAHIAAPGDEATQRMLHARDLLIAAGIPAEIHYRKDKYEDREVDLCEVLVPPNLILYASSVLDKEIFNPEAEESYRAFFSSLSDEELRFADRHLLFAGLQDRLARAKQAYADEVAKRSLADNA
jgi:hypothetical protein